MDRKTDEPPHTPRTKSGMLRRSPILLLVDDAADSREMYGEILRRAGYHVLEAMDGADALSIAFEHSPNLIVMDLCMPRMDGWEAIRRLKSDPRTRSVPVVALTALGWQGQPSDMECAAYLVKPCLPVDLLSVVDIVCAEAAHDERLAANGRERG